MTSKAIKAVGMAAALALTATAAQAQDWKAAVAAGSVGEQSDGYLAVVGGGDQAMVNAVNIKRKSAYTSKAAAEGGTVEAMGIATGCNLIRGLPNGAKYRLVTDAGAAGPWQTKSGAPNLDPRCPR